MIQLLFRIIWQVYPTLWACLLFWSVVLLLEVHFGRKRWREKSAYCWPSILTTIGAVSNATVTVANGGVMPVINTTVHHFGSIWVAGEGHRLLALCDRYAGFSIGDFFIIGGLLTMLVVWAYKKAIPSKPLAVTA